MRGAVEVSKSPQRSEGAAGALAAQGGGGTLRSPLPCVLAANAVGVIEGAAPKETLYIIFIIIFIAGAKDKKAFKIKDLQKVPWLHLHEVVASSTRL